MSASVAMGSVIRAKHVPSAHRHHQGVVNSFGFESDPTVKEVACIRVLSLSVVWSVRIHIPGVRQPPRPGSTASVPCGLNSYADREVVAEAPMAVPSGHLAALGESRAPLRESTPSVPGR
ncbi:hypothetical protein ACH4LT_20705 [Streptomyces clavifer]|uniref:hypothetical protein n=1 Tax=Streptomyces clavifer TaxID=68188 RepID=UPI0037969D3F